MTMVGGMGAGGTGAGGMGSGYSAADRERWLPEDPAVKRSDRDDFARDRGRLIHSASLRRLAAKTQVVSPDSDDFVRNRLTHSFEVAQIGREFGRARLQCRCRRRRRLAHDFGHPAVRAQRRERAGRDRRRDRRLRGQRPDLPVPHPARGQARHPDGRPAGLNLTRASSMRRRSTPGREAWLPGSPKFGVYEDDRDAFAWMRAGRPDGERCLEADVMDWSDDVAYSVHDVEDAIASRRLDPRRLRDRPRSRCRPGVAQGAYAADLTADAIAAALERLLALEVVPRGIRRDEGRPRRAEGHDVPADRPLCVGLRVGDPGGASAPARWCATARASSSRTKPARSAPCSRRSPRTS
jgi:dGTPase